MIGVDAAKVGVALFLAVLVQVSIVSSIAPFGGMPDVVLVTLLAIALLRGSIYGAVAGFWAGLLLDTANLETLGLTSLLLTVGGFWIGRYGETTARDRIHVPSLSVGVVTVLYAVGAVLLHFMLGDPAPLRAVLDALPATVVFNLVLTAPLYALCRRLFPPYDVSDRTHEVRLLG